MNIKMNKLKKLTFVDKARNMPGEASIDEKLNFFSLLTKNF